MDTCDPDAEIADLRKLIKMNTGHSIKLTREQICQVYDDIQGGKLPLPPLIFNSRMGYLIDRKSPLTPSDFDVLFGSTSKRTDLKRIARKVGLKQTEQMTKNQIFDAIGKRLRYMNVHEPIKISKKRMMISKTNNAAVNNTAANNLGLNNAAVNNTAANNLGLNNLGGGNRNSNLNNLGGGNRNSNLNNVGGGNFNTNSAFNNTERNRNVNSTFNNSKKNNVPNSQVSFPKKSLFATMNRPDFANGNKGGKTSMFGGLFGGSKNTNTNYIKANTFNGKKNGYVFKTGNKGTGYYKNEGPVVAQGPLKKPNGFGEPVAPVGPNNKPNKPVNNKPTKVNTGVGNNTVNNKPNKPVNNKPNKVNTGVGNNTVNNKPNKPVNIKKEKVNIGVGNNTVNNKPNKPVNIKKEKVNIGVGNNTVNNKNNKVNIGVGNNTVNNKPNKVNTGVGNNTVNNKNNNGNTIMTNANNKPNKPVNNKNNKVNIGVGNNTVNNKNNNGNTIMTNANNTKPNGNVKPNNNANNTKPNSNGKLNNIEEEPNKENAAVQNNANNQARRKEENRKKAEKEAQEAKKREEIEAKREAAREEIRKRQEALKNKLAESKRIANIEKNLLSIPNVDKVYLTAFRGNKSVENVNKNALANKVKKDLVIRNLRNQLSPLFMGKRRVAYVNASNYNSTKTNIEGQISNKEAKKADLEALKKLSVNAVVSTDYVKAFANGKSFVNLSLNTLKNKRNKDLEVYKLNATNKKGMFGGYTTTVPGTKTMKFIPNAEYNKTLNRAKTALEARRNAKQLAENKRKPKENNAKPNNNVKPNNNAKPNGNAKPNNNANNTKPNGNVKPNNNAKPNGNVKPNNTEFMGPNNKLNTIEEEPNNFKNASNNTFKLNKNTKNKIQNNNNFNASAELNKQLNNEAKRQNRAKNKNNNNNFNAAAELNKQLNNEGKRINRAAKNKNNNNNFNAAAELNKQLNNEGKRQQNVENKKLANRRKKLTNKTEREVAKFMGRIGKWRPAIINAKTITELNNLNKNLNNRIKLRNNIKKSVLTRKEQSEYANMVMKLNKKVANTRKLFENGVNKKISNTTGPLVKGILNKAVANNKRGSFNGGLRLGNNNNNIINGKPKPIYNNSNSNSNNNVKPNMKPNPTFEPNMKNNPTFEKLTNENKKPLISAINKLTKLPQNKKTMFKGRLNSAFKNQNLNKMKAIRNEAIAANKVIQNQLTEEKRLKEEAKEAKRKEEAEKAAAKKAERNAKKKANEEAKEKKKANALKAVENAANAYVAARKPKPSFKALVQKNKERRVMNAVKTAAQKTAISEATGAERVKLAKKFAPRTQANVKKSNNASKMFKTNVRKAAEGAAESAKEKLRKNAEKRATMMNKSSYQAKINSRNFKIPKNRKKIFTSRIQRATTLGQVLKAYENAQSELPK
jgi:hypothetical protein